MMRIFVRAAAVAVLSWVAIGCSSMPDALGLGRRPAWELPPPPPAEGPIVVGTVDSGESAIPYKIITGRAARVQCDTYVTGGEQ